MVYKRFLNLLGVLLIHSLSSGYAGAQNREIGLSHSPPQAAQLPFPGAPLTLSVALVNTKDSQLTLRGYIVRDGKLIEIPLSDVSQDQNERLVFSGTVPAPLGEISYQFILTGPKGILATSKHYSIRRSCLPDVSGIDLTMPPDIDRREELAELQRDASGLQDEVQNYESVKKLLDELKLLTES